MPKLQIFPSLGAGKGKNISWCYPNGNTGPYQILKKDSRGSPKLHVLRDSLKVVMFFRNSNRLAILFRVQWGVSLQTDPISLLLYTFLSAMSGAQDLRYLDVPSSWNTPNATTSIASLRPFRSLPPNITPINTREESKQTKFLLVLPKDGTMSINLHRDPKQSSS